MKNKLFLLTAITFSGTLLSSCSLFNTINYLNLDDYVLEDKIIEYQNIYFQKSNLGYIATSLIDKNVEVVEIPSRLHVGIINVSSLGIVIDNVVISIYNLKQKLNTINKLICQKTPKILKKLPILLFYVDLYR